MIYSRIEPSPGSRANPMQFVCDAIQAVGTEAFPGRLDDLLVTCFGLKEFVVYRVDAANGTPDLLAQAGTDKSAQDRARAYLEGFHREDPIFAVLDKDSADGTYAIRLRAEEIRNPVYRSVCYTRPGFSEKLTLAKRDGSQTIILSVFARHEDGGFDAGQVDELCHFGNLLLPILVLHFRLIGHAERPKQVSAGEMEDCVSWAFPELTQREVAVCARSILGVTAEGIALDLGIAQTSVLTYRRRAYARLNINSINQLSTMLIQSSAARQLAAAS